MRIGLALIASILTAATATPASYTAVELAPRLRVHGVILLTDRHPHPAVAPTAGVSNANVELRIAWPGAWRDARNHDAVWVFVKISGIDAQGEVTVRHARLTGTPAVLDSGSTAGAFKPAIEAPHDRVGFLLTSSAEFRGDAWLRVRVPIEPSALDGLATESIRVAAHGIAMVYVPDGAFFAGAASEEELSYGSFHRVAPDGGFGGPYRIASEHEVIEVGAVAGTLQYRHLENASYMGDGKGPVPADFPKGVAAFYIMKFELSQGEYAAFLNGIASYGADTRANFAGPTYYRDRGTIRLGAEGYFADQPDRPANFVSWEDGIAFLDWAGLRPMTELEYEKAARGPRTPQPFEFAWGTTDSARVRREVLAGGDIGQIDGEAEVVTDDASRERLAASYYGVMDLSGSLWERVVTLGDPAGRAYTGEHGDGNVNPYGDADVQGWPRELGSPRRHKGFGYRGGGYYLPGQEYDRYRPHSPVSIRPYGSWSGGPRHRAYGIRGVRTAQPR
jgi:formylglycine-generating enzyme required for sulfatase activity